MFSGIVAAQGRVTDKQAHAGGDYSLRIAAAIGKGGQPVQAGDSVAVNGVCLTVTERADENLLSFDVSAATAACTTLGALRKNDKVNMEPALRLGERLNGHLVTGHIDGLATVCECRRQGRSLRVRLKTAAELMPYLAVKGSVCLDGVSLTVVSAQANAFAVNIVPYTAEHTHFSSLHEAQEVNLEVDIIARYLSNLMRFAAMES